MNNYWNFFRKTCLRKTVFRIHLMKAIINYFNPSIMGEIYDFNTLVFLELLNYLPRIKYTEQSNSKSIFVLYCTCADCRVASLSYDSICVWIPTFSSKSISF